MGWNQALIATFGALALATSVMGQNLEADGTLPRATPESTGVSSKALTEAIETLDAKTNRVDSIMVLRHGKVIAEAWRAPHDPKMQHALYSLSKSFASTAVGFAVQEGKMSLDQKIVDIFPEEVPADASENLKKMTLRDVLTMTCGHEKEPARPNNLSAFYDREGPNQDGNPTWLQQFMNQPVPYEPGTHYCYNTVGTYVATAALERSVQNNALNYLSARLFEPLKIQNPVWEKSPEGITKGGTGLFLTTEDIAKFGQFYLQKGKWNGEQLLNEAWVEEATSKLVPTSGDATSNWAQGYGFQFWRCLYNAYRGDGMYGQFCVVAPDYDAVIVLTCDSANTQAILNNALDLILPKMQDEPLPEDPEAWAKLQEVEKSLQPCEGGSKSQLIKRVVKDLRGEDVRYIVYVPNGYMTSSESYPVLYLLHGLTDDETTWSSAEKGRMQGIVDEYFTKHPDRKRIIVMPDARATFYRDVYGTDDKYESFFFQTLIPQVEREFRCKTDKADRAIAGLSMGGYGTLLYALKHGEMFSHAFAMSPAVMEGQFRPDPAKTPADELEARTKHAESYDVVLLLEKVKDKNAVPLAIDCGDDDICFPSSMEFFFKARKLKFPIELRVRDGVHYWDYWRVSLPMALDFISGDQP